MSKAGEAMKGDLITVPPGWASNLRRLRNIGVRRSDASAAYAALKGKLSRGSVLLDIGCGDSKDRVIARQRGLIAYGVDLLPPLERSIDGFVRADVRRLPFASSAVDAVICQAMISLIPPDDRYGTYVEVARVLKDNGWFSIVFYSLVDGWRVNLEYEKQRIAATGLHYVRSGLYQKKEIL